MIWNKKIGRRRALKAAAAVAAVPVVAPHVLKRAEALSGQADGSGTGIAVERKTTPKLTPRKVFTYGDIYGDLALSAAHLPLMSASFALFPPRPLGSGLYLE